MNKQEKASPNANGYRKNYQSRLRSRKLIKTIRKILWQVFRFENGKIPGYYQMQLLRRQNDDNGFSLYKHKLNIN